MIQFQNLSDKEVHPRLLVILEKCYVFDVEVQDDLRLTESGDLWRTEADVKLGIDAQPRAVNLRKTDRENIFWTSGRSSHEPLTMEKGIYLLQICPMDEDTRAEHFEVDGTIMQGVVDLCSEFVIEVWEIIESVNSRALQEFQVFVHVER